MKNEYLTNPDLKIEAKHCPVCGALCSVERNVLRYPGYTAALAKIKKPFDVFTCAHAEEAWHRDADALYEEMNRFVSPTLREFVRKDLEKIITHHTTL